VRITYIQSHILTHTHINIRDCNWTSHWVRLFWFWRSLSHSIQFAMQIPDGRYASSWSDEWSAVGAIRLHYFGWSARTHSQHRRPLRINERGSYFTHTHTLNTLNTLNTH
jgi:hypothetical protein